jgi:acyl transferase domain-containing protein
MHLVVLSARDERALQARARALLDALDASLARAPLRDIAYTSQCGREAMDERVAIVCASLVELKARLSAWLAGEGRVEGVHRGNARAGRDALSVLGSDEDASVLVETWMRKHKFDRIAESWARGLAVDWSPLHAGTSPRRVGLPGYPFARERHWVDNPALRAPAGARDELEQLVDEFLERRVDVDGAARHINALLGASRS